MAISSRVLLPGNPQEQKKVQQDKDPLDTILKGLQIAQGIYGIKTGIEQSNLRDIQRQLAEEGLKQQQKQTALAEFQERGGLTPQQQQQVTFVQEEDPLYSKARVGLIKRPVGEEEVRYFTQEDLQRNLAGEIAQNKKEQDKLEKQLAAEKDSNKNTKDFYESYRTATKNLRWSIDGLNKVEAAVSNPNPTGATDIALIFAFMKAIDPESVVREGEFSTAAKSQGRIAWAKSQIEKLKSGQLLTPEARQAFLRESQRSVLRRLDVQIAEDKNFEKLADLFNVKKDLVFSPIFKDTYERLAQMPDVTAGILPENKQQNISGQGQLIPQKIGNIEILPKAYATPKIDIPTNQSSVEDHKKFLQQFNEDMQRLRKPQ